MNIGTRKLIWSVPLVAVLAVAGALAIFAAQMPGTALAHDPPGVVGNLMGEADGQNQIDLSWDAPAMGGTPTSYRIDRSINGNTWMTHKTGHTTRTYSDTGLKSGTSYYYRVFAVNSAGTGPVSQDYQVQTDAGMAPSAVIQLRAAAMGQNQVNLTWMAPAKLNGSPVEKYFIHFASGADPQIPAVDATLPNEGIIEVAAEDGMSYEHKELDAATRYSYIVYPENATGKSAARSNTASATTAALVKPGAPTGVTAVQTDARDFTLYWFAPTETGGTAVIDYEVHASYNGGPFAEETGITWTGAGADPETISADSSAHTVDEDTGGDNAVPITRVQYRVYAITRNAVTTATPPVTELKSTGYGQSKQMSIVAERLTKVPAAPDIESTIPEASRDPKGNVNLDWDAPLIESDDEIADNAPPSIGGYRIDVSDDGINWRELVNHTRKTTTKYQYVDPEREDRHYRVFAWHAQYLGPAQTNVAVSALDSGTPVAPDHVTGFTATAVGPTQIDLAWTAPENDGGAPIVRYQIAGVRQADDTFAAFAADQAAVDSDTTGNLMLATSKTTGYMHKELNAGETWQYRVLTVTDDGSDTANIRTATATSAETRRATTHQADLPMAPEGLTAEDAKDSSDASSTARGVLLLWNAPNPPDGAMIGGYRIQRKKGDAAWETLVMNTNNTFTDYTDTSEPAAGELRAYRVAALNGSKAGAWAMVYYPHALAQPGKPTLTAMKDADMPGTKVKLTWTAPDMNADLVTGYIIERRHAGDMMGDIPSDGYNDGVMGRSHAFMDYKEWWETLNCKGMLAVAGSSASVTATTGESAQDTADRDMYCKHFANTAPTNMAFAGKTVSEATAMKIKEMFMKRYVTDDMGKTMTMFTGMMHTDMGLMENTEYTYRVRAIHGMKAGLWSDKVMVTTGSDNNDPIKVGTIDPVTVEVGETSDPMDVSGYFSDTDNDTLTYRAMSSDDDTATAEIGGDDMNMLTITGVAEDTATVTVYASDGKGGTDAMQTIDVTVTAAVLGKPTMVEAEAEVDDTDSSNPVNNVTVTWENGANADVHWIHLLDLSDWTKLRSERIADLSVTSHTFNNVASSTYVAIVESTLGEAYDYAYKAVAVD